MSQFFFLLLGFTLSFTSLRAETVDWGVQPYSADYQSFTFSKMTARPEQVVDRNSGAALYLNPYPGIKNTEYYFNDLFYRDEKNKTLVDTAKRGVPLALRFIFAVEKDDPALAEWMKSYWYPHLQPTDDPGSDGHCDSWSAWSMDPQMHLLLDRFKDGLMCHEIPFSRGEIKELITSVYSIDPKPEDRQYTQHLAEAGLRDSFYQNSKEPLPEKLEGANIALSHLGLMGAGGLAPGQVLEMAKASRQAGKVMIFDRDPSEAIWNQPIKSVSDEVVSGPKRMWDYVPMNQLQSAREDGGEVLHILTELERVFSIQLYLGQGVEFSTLCALGSQLSPTLKCDEENMTLVQQVELFLRLKKYSVEKGILKFKDEFSSQGPLLIPHDLTLEYGIENPFASMNPDQMIKVTYRYLEVRDRLANGTEGPPRSYWATPARSLGLICALGGDQNRVTNGLTRAIDFKALCSTKSDSEKQKMHFFVGAVPPKHFMEIFPAPVFRENADAQKKKKLYAQLLTYLAGGCTPFDGAAEFLRALDQNSSSIDLKSEFARQRSFLDEKWLRSRPKASFLFN